MILSDKNVENPWSERINIERAFVWTRKTRLRGKRNFNAIAGLNYDFRRFQKQLTIVSVHDHPSTCPIRLHTFLRHLRWPGCVKNTRIRPPGHSNPNCSTYYGRARIYYGFQGSWESDTRF